MSVFKKYDYWSILESLDAMTEYDYNRNRNISSQLVNAQISLETPRQKWRGVLINQCTEN